MRILQVIETGGPGGAETVFARLSSGLSDRGHHVHCVTREGSWLPTEIATRGLPWSAWQSGGAFDIRLVRRLRDLMRTERIDVVHAHLFDGAVYAALAARSMGIPTVVTLHGQVDVKAEDWKSTMKARLLRVGASRIVAVSATLCEDLGVRLKVPPQTFRIITNGVPVPALNEITKPRSDGRRIIAIGNIRAPKNYALLLESFSKVRLRVSDVRLDILGEPDRGTLFTDLQDQVRRLGLDDAVTFHGFVANPQVLLSNAHLLVQASSKEGFSLAIVEAMLSGVPVVSTRSGGPEEIITHESNGLLVPVNDSDALADAIVRVLGEDLLAQRLSENGLQHARTSYGLDGMVSSYERLYLEVLR
jgi:glycosyltransferase involved in cell wall biosynthesis